MSTPPLPSGMPDTALHRAANALHSMAIHLLRRARIADRQSGLTPERLSLLSVLVFAGPRTIGALAEIEQVSLPAISRIVSALEADGLAARTRSEDDARIVAVNATPKGRRQMEAARQRRLALVAQDLEGLTARELQGLVDLARALGRSGPAR